VRRDQALRFFSSWDERNAAMMVCAEFAPRPSREGCRYCRAKRHRPSISRSSCFFRPVALNPALDGSDPGGILALRDRDGDGRADEQVRFFDRGQAGHDRGRWVARPQLPVSGDGNHVSKTFVVTRHGRLFVNIGSGTNSCQVANRQSESPGIDPCPELAVRAGVWRFSLFRRNQTQEDGERFATGLRNMAALDMNRRDGRLYGVQQGRDQLFENWPQLYTREEDAVLPSEESARILAVTTTDGRTAITTPRGARCSRRSTAATTKRRDAVPT
jgi:hypothetical protein